MATVTIPKILANFETALDSKISASATELTLRTSTDDDGTTLSGAYSLTIDEGTTKEEHMIVTLTGASGTISRRGLSRVDAWTEVSGNKFKHERGANVKITNLSLINITRLLSGTDTFSSVNWTGINSITGLALPTAAETTKAASVQFVINATTAGATDATDANKGITKLSVAAVSASDPIAVGNNDPRVPTQSENDALAGTSGTPSSTNPFVTTVDRRVVNVYKYGDGSDGNVTISSPTTLTRDMYYNNLTLNDGVTLTTAGYRVFVAGTLTQLGTGKFECIGGNGGNGGNGTAGVSPVGGAGGTGGTAGAASASGTLKGGAAGVAGGAGGTGANQSAAGGASPSGNAGIASTASITNPTASSQAGVAGGAGGTSGAPAGGTVGTVGTAGSVVSSGVKIIDVLPFFNNFSAFVGGTLRQLEYHAGNGGSTGGGGGACSSSPGAGGGGGGAGGSGGNGGTIAIFANAIVTASNPIASVVGGNGGNGGNGATGANIYGGGGGGAGGGGGNGGLVFITYVSLTGSLTATLTGGTGGTGGTGAAGSGGGASGSNGNSGTTGLSGLLITVST